MTLISSKKVLRLEGAKRIAQAAEQEALRQHWNVVIAVVDDGGHLIYLERLDGTQLVSVEVAQEKARSALRFKRPTKALNEMLTGGNLGLLSLPGAVPVEGGLPLVLEDQILGAIGVSGVTSQQDGVVAQAGVEEFAKIAREATSGPEGRP